MADRQPAQYNHTTTNNTRNALPPKGKRKKPAAAPAVPPVSSGSPPAKKSKTRRGAFISHAEEEQAFPAADTGPSRNRQPRGTSSTAQSSVTSSRTQSRAPGDDRTQQGTAGSSRVPAAMDTYADIAGGWDGDQMVDLNGVPVAPGQLADDEVPYSATGPARNVSLIPCPSN